MKTKNSSKKVEYNHKFVFNLLDKISEASTGNTYFDLLDNEPCNILDINQKELVTMIDKEACNILDINQKELIEYRKQHVKYIEDHESEDIVNAKSVINQYVENNKYVIIPMGDLEKLSDQEITNLGSIVETLTNYSNIEDVVKKKKKERKKRKTGFTPNGNLELEEHEIREAVYRLKVVQGLQNEEIYTHFPKEYMRSAAAIIAHCTMNTYKDRELPKDIVVKSPVA